MMCFLCFKCTTSCCTATMSVNTYKIWKRTWPARRIKLCASIKSFLNEGRECVCRDHSWPKWDLCQYGKGWGHQKWPRLQTPTGITYNMFLTDTMFHRVVERLSTVSKPLTVLTCKIIGIQKSNWECDKAFLALRNLLITSPIPISPHYST